MKGLKNVKLAVLLSILVPGCKPELKNESTVTDSKAVVVQPTPDAIPTSTEIVYPSPETILENERYFKDVSEFLVTTPLDTSEFQLISETCAILVEETRASIQSRQDFFASQEAEHQAMREKMSAAELAHDDSVTAEMEIISGDDGMWYEYEKQNGLEAIAASGVKVVTAQEKGYLKLIDANKKEWVVDIRSSMEQGWTVIFFNILKEPKVLEVNSVKKELVIQYFLMNEK